MKQISIFKLFVLIIAYAFLMLLFQCNQNQNSSTKLLNLFSGSILKPNPTGTFTIGGNIQGLKGTIILQNNGTDNLTLSTNGSFTFSTQLAKEAIYYVTVLSQPANQNCSVSEGQEFVYDSDIDSIWINCVTIPVRYTIGGTLSQLKQGNRVILFSNRGEELPLSDNGSFLFKSGFVFGNSYSISVSAQPGNQNCIISNPSGRMPERNLGNLEVNCFGNVNGALVNGTIINPLLFTGSGVTSFAGSFCDPDTSCSTGLGGFTDSTDSSIARFQNLEGIITDGKYLYVADKSNHRIRKIILDSGETTTLAGNGIASLVDGFGSSASVRSPEFITTDGLNIYVLDLIGYAIRKINLTSSQVSTIISSSLISGSKGILIANNNLYTTDNTNKAIRRVNLSTGIITTIVTTNISLSSPKGMTIIGSDIYMIDANRILKMSIGLWAVSIFAGGNSGFIDGIGSSSAFNNPEGITTDGSNLYISDSGNHAIRKVALTNANVTTLAGTASLSSGYSNSSNYGNALFDSPGGITSDGTALYLADRNNNCVRKIR